MFVIHLWIHFFCCHFYVREFAFGTSLPLPLPLPPSLSVLFLTTATVTIFASHHHHYCHSSPPVLSATPSSSTTTTSHHRITSESPSSAFSAPSIPTNSSTPHHTLFTNGVVITTSRQMGKLRFMQQAPLFLVNTEEGVLRMAPQERATLSHGHKGSSAHSRTSLHIIRFWSIPQTLAGIDSPRYPMVESSILKGPHGQAAGIRVWGTDTSPHLTFSVGSSLQQPSQMVLWS